MKRRDVQVVRIALSESQSAYRQAFIGFVVWFDNKCNQVAAATSRCTYGSRLGGTSTLNDGVSETSVRAAAGWSNGAMVGRWTKSPSGEIAVEEFHRSWSELLTIKISG